MPLGCSCRWRPGPLRRESGPLESELQGLDSPPERALWVGRRSWGEGGGPAELEAAAGGEGCWTCLAEEKMKEEEEKKTSN